GRKTSIVRCHHCLLAAHTVELRRMWHSIITLRHHRRSYDVGRGMSSTLWTTHMVKQRRAWHAIISLGKHIQFDDICCGMPTWPLGSTQSRMTLGVTCHNHT
ncbi:hypothetical protein EJD97_013575, partial [Solanum chilense]